MLLRKHSLRAALGLILLTAMRAAVAAAPAAPASPGVDWAAARQFWSFQAPRMAEVPTVRHAGWPRSRVDQFILVRLEAAGLQPAAPADRRVLARRVYFDLAGLPPTPDELATFLADTAPDSYTRLVDDLLNRRAFGEHLASLWLNVARYAEDQAHQVGNNSSLNYPFAWKYREWVINAFNADLPYDQFIKHQLAVDLLEPENRADLPALGFLGLGHKLYSRGRLDVQAEEWADKVDTVTRAFLGLTVACARCHDHKYDPVTMQDYYGLAGVFASIKMVNRTAAGVLEKDGTNAEKMDRAVLHLVQDDKPQDLNLFLRGDVEQKGPLAPRRFLQVLANEEPPALQTGSGRGDLAHAIASRANPLTARVLVNRVWERFFGRALVSTPSNFGRLGAAPTHPELLDDLAVRFMEHGWSLKWLARELALSATYQQTADAPAASLAADPGNRLLGRMSRRRLAIEPYRDAILQIAGQLEPDGGASLDLNDPENHRRTVYSKVSRRELNKTLMLFDYPDANVHAADRSESITATQKLFTMNSPFMLEAATALAKRLQAEAPDEAARIVLAYEKLFARKPAGPEVEWALAFLRQSDSAVTSRWERYAHALLSANELMYLD